MIQLSNASSYSHLANPPTHAILTSINVCYQPWFNGLKNLRLNYQLGTMSAGVGFVLCDYVPTMEVAFPTPYAGELHVDQYALLTAFFEQSGKQSALDLSVDEIDGFCIANVADLAGTIVHYTPVALSESLSTSDSVEAVVIKAE